MTIINNVSVDKNTNIYFNGNVISRNIILPDNSIKTLGVMLVGSYSFNTSKKEIMEITSGELEFLLSGECDWKNYKEGMSFQVPGNSSFKVKVIKITNYCCSYID